ncbi:MAG: type I DNA topoisomerase [Proteobacteria bacterium]|nr:type I DNA topoisomerase [Pseudomonadota bacterium]
MPNTLIIVESPTKVKTIKKYLGSDFDVRASVGHVKDLPKKTLGIDVEGGFEPTYGVIEKKKKVVSELKKAAKNVDNIYLAPDPDREGEAIAWHIAEEIGTKNKNIYRVLFNDLTKSTILKAIKNPLKLDQNKYEAQQTRRILDRLVGYQISPILWEKVKWGLSAGRVQSVAVRMICDREEEIQKFVPEEYWNITALLEGSKPPQFEARLIKINAKKAKVKNEAQTNGILKDLESAPFVISKIEKKETKRSPLPPFTTSKLQQEASRRLSFTAKKTMSVAQKLYEGINLGKEGSVGLITYMRTDSFRISAEALAEARSYINQNYGKEFLPAKPRVFKSPRKAQEAHESIRPASMLYKPEDIKQYLSDEQFRLYQLIWNRFVASQMNPAIFDQTTIDISAGDYLFRVQGAVMKFAGFTIVYTEARDDAEGENGSGKTLPELQEGEVLSLLAIKPEQKFTQPPPRFSEATLVKALEENGIGRPSTYAAILSTIQGRDYVRLENRRFHPTELGTLITELLVDNFPKILDIDFTASLEDQLDMIEEGKLKRLDTLRDFYIPFEEALKKAKTRMRNLKGEETPTDITCDKCKSPMVKKWGRFGWFLKCTGCDNTTNLTQDENGNINRKEEQTTDTVCSKCGKNMVVKEGRFGRFLGCSGYPECKNTMPIGIGVKCPEENCTGELCEKRTKKGRIFFGCSNYPKCSYALWDKPIPEECPQCKAPFLVEKYTRGKGYLKTCINKDCGYKEKK